MGGIPLSIEAIRAKSEEKLGFAIKKLNRRHRKRILAAIEQYGDIERIPPAFWEELRKELENESAALLLLVLIAAHDSTNERLGVEPDAAELETRRRALANQRAETLARDYVGNTRKRMTAKFEELRQRVESAKAKLREIRKAAAEVLSDKRAEGVAITETTNGISKGQGEGVRDFEAVNPQTKVIMRWKTQLDGKVCPVCQPLDGKNQTQWGPNFPDGPPAHVHCRCFLQLIKRPTQGA